MNPIAILTRADDCGSSHSANLGIQQALEGGILKNISLMAPCDCIEEAAEMFAGRPDLCFGLHATLNAEWDKVKWGPLLTAAKVPSLTDENGMFLPSPKAFLLNPPDLDEIMEEFRAQLNRARTLGFRISYIDSHMAPEFDVPGLEERMREWCLKEELLYWGDYCSSMKRTMETDDLIEDMVSRLQAADEGQYLYVGHPAVDSPEMRELGNREFSGDRIAAGRVMEQKMFTDPRILQTICKRGIVPIRYDEAVKITERLLPLNKWLLL